MGLNFYFSNSNTEKKVKYKTIKSKYKILKNKS